ncbi:MULTISPECIES: pyocin S6 family toxin immunity protein [unclassified Pseudomonas]|uniref:pyocin S6 family toxin immunity protein n=1 Tax=unclassified Pseudomonas TaxID=196821 RepID=UPI002A36A726|nr:MULTISPECIES: pyocin S6 family toxin immunity protein [unclassified Pseudomonas]
MDTMRCFSITGFYPDDKKDDSLQFETCIKNAEQNEALAQITEAKPFNAVEPGELEITEEQLKKIEKTLDMEFPAGLEYFIGTSADTPSTKTKSKS